MIDTENKNAHQCILDDLCNSMKTVIKKRKTSLPSSHLINFLQSGIPHNKTTRHLPLPFTPSLTSFLKSAKIADGAENLVSPLQKLEAQTRRNVERDVAMHQPSTGVVALERENEIPTSRQRRGIPADRIVLFQPRDVAAPLRVLPRVQDVEVMTVEMDGMGKRRSTVDLLNDPVLPLIDFTNRVDVIRHRDGEVVLNDILQSRLLEVDDHGAGIDDPLYQVALSSRDLKAKFEALGLLLRYFSRDIRDDIGFIVAALWQSDAGRVSGTGGGTFVGQDAASICRTEVWAVALAPTVTDAEPIVSRGLVGVDNDVVTLACGLLAGPSSYDRSIQRNSPTARTSESVLNGTMGTKSEATTVNGCPSAVTWR